jgi:hypothetical protein
MLNHMPQSMKVTGQKSGLPEGDRVGTILNHINPSMAARLADEWNSEPHSAGGPPDVSSADVNRKLRLTAGILRDRVCLSNHITATWGCRGPAFRSAPIEPAGLHISRTIDLGGPGQAAVQSTHDRPWPWNSPLPPPAPPSASAAATPYWPRVYPVLGEMLDILA